MTRLTDRMEQRRNESLLGRPGASSWQERNCRQLAESERSSWLFRGRYPQPQVHMGSWPNQEDVPFKRPRLTLSEQLDLLKKEERVASRNSGQKLQPHSSVFAFPRGHHRLNQTFSRMTAACGENTRRLPSERGKRCLKMCRDKDNERITKRKNLTKKQLDVRSQSLTAENCPVKEEVVSDNFDTLSQLTTAEICPEMRERALDNTNTHSQSTTAEICPVMGDMALDNTDTLSQSTTAEICPVMGDMALDNTDTLSQSTTAEICPVMGEMALDNTDTLSQSTTAEICPVMGEMALDNTDTLSQSTTAEICPVMGEMALDNIDTLSQSTTAEICPVMGEMALDNIDTLSQSTTAEICPVMGEMALDNTDALSQSTTAEICPVMGEMALDNIDTLSQSTTAEICPVMGEMALDNIDTLSQSTTAEICPVMGEMALDNTDTLSQSTTAEIRPRMEELGLNRKADMSLYTQDRHTCDELKSELQGSFSTCSQSTTAEVRPVLDNLNLTLEDSFDSDAQDFDTCSVSTITGICSDDQNLPINSPPCKLKAELLTSAQEVFSQIMDKKEQHLRSLSLNPLVGPVQNSCVKTFGDEQSTIQVPDDMTVTTVKGQDAENDLVKYFGECPEELDNCLIHCFSCDEHFSSNVEKRNHEGSRRHIVNIAAFSKHKPQDLNRGAVGKWISVSLDDHLSVLGTCKEGQLKLKRSEMPNDLLIEKLKSWCPHLKDVGVRVTSKLIRYKSTAGVNSVARRGTMFQYRHAGQLAWTPIPHLLLSKVKKAIKDKRRRPARRIKEKERRKQIRQSSRASEKMASGELGCGKEKLKQNHCDGTTRELNQTISGKSASLPSGERHLPRTMTQPQDYQLEMYKAAIHDDSVCVMPEGTKECLVSAMVIDHMLHLNPSQPVLVLVEKLSEMLRISSSLMTQIGQNVLIRTDRGSGFKMQRKTRIGCFCEELVESQDHSLAYLDIIVVTSDYFPQMLDKRLLKWSDFSLFVLPDARCAFSCNGFPALPGRPKILGFLTPTMHDNKVNDMEKILNGVLKKIGGAEIYVRHLKKMTDSKDGSCLLLRHSKLNEAESDFMSEISLYITELYKTLMKSRNQLLHRLILELGGSEKWECSDGIATEEFDSGTIERIQDGLHVAISCRDLLKLDEMTISFLQHFHHICTSFLGLLYGSTGVAAHLLNELNKELCSFRFTRIGSVVPRSELLAQIKNFNTLQLFKSRKCIDELLPNMSAIHLVVKELVEVDWSVRLCGKHPIVAVVVQSPIMGRIWNHLLERSDFLRMLNLKPACVSGQDRQGLMQRLHQHSVQILVMTPEDVDLAIPELELVIQLTPPSRMVHLGCRHMMLCRTIQEIKAIRTLKKSEKNLVKAAEKLKGL
ncbi:uncharacterized protein LOC135497117 [Lineus longissimus]|uniref:uncharacterized protein LOC135497117 n=1 Tax=Lineus longissimus TaxID=88925 RepID=UPI00315C6B0D